jgi:hypothetical protein
MKMAGEWANAMPGGEPGAEALPEAEVVRAARAGGIGSHANVLGIKKD